MKKLFSEIPRIESARLLINRIVDADADALQELMDNDDVYRYEPTYLFERQFDDAHEVIGQLYGDLFMNKESLILGIRMKEDGALCGLAEFYGLSEDRRKVSIGCRLLERYWGCGIATEATSMMLDYLHNQTDIELVTASTMVGNVNSAHVLEKAGLTCIERNVAEDWGFDEPMVTDKWVG